MTFEAPKEQQAYPLPRVTEEIQYAVVADINENGIGAFLREAEAQLSTHNEYLYSGLRSFARGMNLQPGTQAFNAAHKFMLITHELLRRQAEADELREHFNQADS